MSEREFKSIREIYEYSRKLLNKKVEDIINSYWLNKLENNKGSIGNAVQQSYFGIPVNSKQAPDFEELGLELKICPLKIIGNNKLYPKERLVFGMIDYTNIAEEEFENSAFFKKNKFVQLIFYKHDFGTPKLKYEFINSCLLNLEALKEFEIIKQEWMMVKESVLKGEAHLLTERDFNILSPCTKGRGNNKDLVDQPFSNIKAKKRAFSFKTKFLDILNNRYNAHKNKNDWVDFLNKDVSYTEYVDQTEIINVLKNMKNVNLEEYLTKIKGKNISNIKQWRRMAFDTYLKENYNYIFQFLKNAQSDYTVGVEDDMGIFQEHIRLKVVLNPDEILHTPTFEESDLYDKLFNTKHLVFQVDSRGFLSSINEFKLNEENIEICKGVWENTKLSLIHYQNNVLKNKSSKPVFIKPKDEKIIHIRPHAIKGSDYYKSKINSWEFSKQDFWLNKKFYLENKKTLWNKKVEKDSK